MCSDMSCSKSLMAPFISAGAIFYNPNIVNAIYSILILRQSIRWSVGDLWKDTE